MQIKNSTSIFFFIIFCTFIFSQEINAITLNTVAVCHNEQYQALKCNNTINANAKININEINKIYVVANIKNESLKDQVITIRYIFHPSRENSFALKDTLYENKSLKPLPKSNRSKIKKGSVFDIKLLVKNSPTYRTFAYKTLDRKMHIGKWQIQLIDHQENLNFDFKFELVN